MIFVFHLVNRLMRKRFEYLGLSVLSWILLFQLFRLIFLVYETHKGDHIPPGLIPAIAFHGLKMDLSFACYLVMIPTLVTAFTAAHWNWYSVFLKYYSRFTTFLVALLLVSDLEMFRAWGFRVDATPLSYLLSPTEAWASVSSSPLLFLFSLLGITLFFTNKLFQTLIIRTVPHFSETSRLLTIPVFIVSSAALIIPIRGGLQLAPMNQSTVYFSENNFANNAAVNPCWNFFNSLVNGENDKKNPFLFLDEKTAQSLIADLKMPAGQYDTPLLDTTKQVNVLIIIWESLTAKAVGSLNGMPGITPRFDSLSKEGIFFRSIYASGNRSDKGMVATLSGYPAQPTTSIIKIPTKTSSLPSLPKSFKEKGYFTSFYYGGESEFANMKSYFLQQGFDRLTDKNQFEEKDMNSKWGAHDHVVYNRLLTDLDSTRSPFFTTLFTLSSHEPFEVPVPTVIKGNDEQNLFLNALHYADASLGDFITKAKTRAWWNNTLVIILADHGHVLPRTSKREIDDFHIPMLWLGGALKKNPMVIDTLASQTDLAASLLGQLGMPHDQYKWSTSIFQPNRQSFAYFAFNNGFGWLRPKGYIVHDNVSRKVIEKSGNLTEKQVNTGRAYLQTSFADFLNR